MRAFDFIRRWRWLPAAVGAACLFVVLHTQPVYAQPPTCDDVITQLDGALAPGVCQALGLGSACLATRSVTATPRTGTIRFTAPGDQARLNNIRQMVTVPQKGAAVLLGGSTANPVKILVFGDTATTPNANQAGNIFTLRARNGTPTCERTRSGMILQTPTGKKGAVVINGVTINLGSTAYVVPGADVLFDQDPRQDRRQGTRNRNAPLCSGFDSDCGFGDDTCSRSDRLVWGPFCREDSYEYIAQGLYRVTLYGEGEVQAGATDYGVERSYDLFGTQRLSLPGSYTFCWEGLQDGGTGFETVVQARSSNAYVDHITLEYLGQDCGLSRANDPRAGMSPDEMGVLSIYNVQGGVDVSLPDGEENSPESGQRLRVYFEDGEAVGMDAITTDAPYVVDSELAQWAMGATGGGLPQVEVCAACAPDETGATEPEPRTPFVTVTAEVVDDDGRAGALRIEAQAYDPAVGRSNGAGIDYVYFTIYDPSGNIVFENDEQNAAYCAFGGDSPCPPGTLFDLAYAESLPAGTFVVEATAFTARGQSATARTEFALRDSSAPTSDTTPPEIAAVYSEPSNGFCAGGELSIMAEVYDDSTVGEVTLWWRAYTDDGSVSDFAAYGMEGSNSAYRADLSGANAEIVEYYVSATDTAGNYVETAPYSISGAACDSY
jgi:hypothetical protein